MKEIKEQPRYQLTQFYCETHKKWHTIKDKQFYSCIVALPSKPFRVERLPH